jgi:hypothetical protein
MSAVEAKRTLVKSPPEVWAKVSDPEVLADHLQDLGPVRITRTEPEAVVLWEGDHSSGSVALEAGGWGTRVTLTAEVVEAPSAVEPETPVVEPEPEGVCDVLHDSHGERDEPPRGGWWSRVFKRRRRRPVQVDPPPPPPPEPEVTRPEPEPEPEPTANLTPPEALAVLEAALDRLGAAHHRPFSRA